MLTLGDSRAAPEAEPATLRPLRLVVVEDNEDIRQTLQDILEMAGHSVVVAADGNAGVEAVLREKPDIALVDIGLPGLDGYGVARELRSLSCATRLIAMSGYGRPEDQQRSLQSGFDAHLVKPVHPDRLFRILESHAATIAPRPGGEAPSNPLRVSDETRRFPIGD